MVGFVTFGLPNPAAIGCHLTFPTELAELDSIGFGHILSKKLNSSKCEGKTSK